MASGAGHSNSDAAGKAQDRREAERQAGARQDARGFPRRGRKDKPSFGANTANHASEGLDPQTVKRPPKSSVQNEQAKQKTGERQSRPVAEERVQTESVRETTFNTREHGKAAEAAPASSART